jgi:hypothetical protein
MIADCPGRGDVDGGGDAIDVGAPSGRVPHLMLMIAGVVIVLSSTAALARMMEWFPAPAAGSDEIRALDESSLAITPGSLPRVAGHRRGKSSCIGCGAIVSIREARSNGAAGSKPAGPFAEIAAQPAKSYEFTIRLRDGSMRVISDANPAAWRVGERVNVIDSVTLSSR